VRCVACCSAVLLSSYGVSSNPMKHTLVESYLDSYFSAVLNHYSGLLLFPCDVVQLRALNCSMLGINVEDDILAQPFMMYGVISSK
jgi:hypothetical protein